MIRLNFFSFKNYKFDLDKRPYVMGILNLTPDSFSDGGKWNNLRKAIYRAQEIEEQGADFLDIGAQSTRPGYIKVNQDEEWNRLGKALEAIKSKVKIPVSIDTFYVDIAKKSLEMGADIINDITGCNDSRMFEITKKYNCGLIINHNFGNLDIKTFFQKKLHQAIEYGINSSQICFDPGIGFEKNRIQDGYIIKHLKDIKIPQNAVLIGASRKRLIGACCGNPPPSERMAGTIAADTIAILNGANIIRVHDVKESVQALKVTNFINNII